MNDNTLILRKTEYPFHAAAKQLYNLALFSVGDKTLAEQTAAGAFADAFKRIKNTSDIGHFQQLCCAILYRYCKKAQRQQGSGIIARDAEEHIRPAAECHKLSELLVCLSFEERFIVLLFCLQKYPVQKIAKITRLPCFLIEKRLVAALGKTSQ